MTPAINQNLRRLWLVIEEDEFRDVDVTSGHATKDEAEGVRGKGGWVTYVDIPAERIDCLLPPEETI